MTVSLSAGAVAKQIMEQLPGTIIEASGETMLVKDEAICQVIEYLKNKPELDFNYLNYITAVDYYQYFELVYQLTSFKHNHTLVLKTRCYDRVNPSVPSIVSLHRGADFQEREIYDLMGVGFSGHPNLKRIALWEGFQGHPLRKDYL